MTHPARIASISGIAGAAVVLLLTVIGGAAFPGYSHARQYISELGAHGAPHGAWVTYAGFLPAAILLIVFAISAAKALPRSRWTALAMFGIGLFAFGYLNSVPFRCDYGCRPEEPSASQMLHNLGGLAGYLSAPLALLMLAVQARHWPQARFLRWFAGVAGVVSLIAIAGLDAGFSYAGVSQRLLESCVLGWIVACSFYLRAHPALRATGPDSAIGVMT